MFFGRRKRSRGCQPVSLIPRRGSQPELPSPLSPAAQLRPLGKPCGRARRTVRKQAQLAGQAREVRGLVDVITRLGEGHSETKNTRTCSQRIKRAASSHSLRIKQLCRHSGTTYKVVPAVSCRTYH